MTEFVTSDIHFYHNNILKFCPETRPYEDKHDMNEKIVKRWNQRVKPTDTVFFLGDFTFKLNKVDELLEQLNGNIVWILGNHDPYHKNRKFQQAVDMSPSIIGVYDYLEIKRNKLTYVMCHYPMYTWNKCHHGSIMLHGHCHGDVPYEVGSARIMDVGWDGEGNGDLLTISEIEKIMLDRPYSKHHY